MREIKFRIYADNKFYYKCLVGNTNDIEDKKWTCPMVWLEDKKEWVNCDNGIIQQYIGMKDINGIEIYEGDIILIGEKRRKVIVTFKNESFGFINKSTCISPRNFNPEVIGNIYDNKGNVK